MDILVFVEATIYQLDEDNELLAKAGQAPEGEQLQGTRYHSNRLALLLNSFCGTLKYGILYRREHAEKRAAFERGIGFQDD